LYVFDALLFLGSIRFYGVAFFEFFTDNHIAQDIEFQLVFT
jgi:hypothetical protein